MNINPENAFQDKHKIREKYVISLLLVLGIIRSIVLFLAYAPADGADGMKYYLYSAYIAGVPLHPLVSEYSPLYPVFIYVHKYILGNFDLIFVSQFIMSSSLGVIYYMALKPYNKVLGLIIALIILGDAQTGLNFNFASTEPLYIFLLSLAFAFSMQLRRDNSVRKGIAYTLLLGSCIALLHETRTVGTFLIVPVSIVVAIQTRNVAQILSLIISYTLILFAFTGLLKLNNVQQSSVGNQIMVFNFFNQYDTLEVDVEDETSGTYNLQQAMDVCSPTTNSSSTLLDCMQNEVGSQTELNNILRRAYLETAVNRLFDFTNLMYTNVTKFIRMSGHQMFEPEKQPAEAQCADISARHERTMSFYATIWSDTTLTEIQYNALETTTLEFTKYLCPPSVIVPELQRLAWYISFRYRFLSRPNSYIWYGIVSLLVLFVPQMKKMRYPVFMAGSVILYHACVSAVALNVQPRYVVVTNPFKAILIFSVIILIVQWIYGTYQQSYHQHQSS